MLLQTLVAVSAEVAATRSRLGKRDLIAALLRDVALEGDESQVDVAASYLSGTLRQRRTGVGWRSLASLPTAAEVPSLDLAQVDTRLEVLSTLAGTGSAALRRQGLEELFGPLTAPEQDFLRALITGQVRQGALDAVMLDAIAAAADLPAPTVRGAAMFSALTGPLAVAALTGGEEALARFTLEAGRPVRPMLASTAPDVAAGVDKLDVGDGVFAADTKLDGIRIQVHKRGDEVLVFTRSLDEISPRLPEVVRLARALPVRDVVLDGEALTLDADGRPRSFQETASRTSTRADEDGTQVPVEAVHPFYFDLLLVDDEQLVTAPARERLRRLDEVVPAAQRVARLVTDDPARAQAHFEEVVGQGQEGVVLKRLDATYAAGRRGSAWVKVKPRHTLDLVVLAVEWGSGRRRGWLSNLHLGARDPSGAGFVMLGKTFKGMTDEMLAWQTERFLGLETHREGHTVFVRPEQLVEIAFDGVQRSTRYRGGVALRFARVLRYREDKAPAEADTLETVRSYGA